MFIRFFRVYSSFQNLFNVMKVGVQAKSSQILTCSGGLTIAFFCVSASVVRTRKRIWLTCLSLAFSNSSRTQGLGKYLSQKSMGMHFRRDCMILKEKWQNGDKNPSLVVRDSPSEYIATHSLDLDVYLAHAICRRAHHLFCLRKLS